MNKDKTGIDFPVFLLLRSDDNGETNEIEQPICLFVDDFLPVKYDNTETVSGFASVFQPLYEIPLK